MAIRITCAYKTVPTNTILDVAALLPLKLQAADKYKAAWSTPSFNAGNKNRFY